jgi:antitoxin HicB
MSLSYRINLEPDDNGSLLVTCPALPEVTTFGDDESDAMKRARGAIEEAIAARMSEGQDIPDGDGPGPISRTAVGARRPQSGAVSAGAP